MRDCLPASTAPDAPDATPSREAARIAIIIVNYRTADAVLGSLQRLAALQPRWPGLRVFIVDNHSPDDSARTLAQGIQAQGLGAWVSLIAHTVNGGFAAGNNVGVRAARSQPGWQPAYCFFLNPDAYVQPDTLDHLLAFARQRPDAVLGAVLTDENGVARTSSFRCPGPLTEFQRGAGLGLVARLWPASQIGLPVPATPQPADWVSGAAFWVPVPVLDKVGEMDEGFFLYFEEVDYMLKVRQAGFGVWLVPDARVVHLAGMATGIVGGQVAKRRMPAYWYQSWHRFFVRHHGRAGAWLAGCLWMAGLLINRTLALALPHRRRRDGHHLRDFFKHGLLGR